MEQSNLGLLICRSLDLRFRSYILSLPKKGFSPFKLALLSHPVPIMNLSCSPSSTQSLAFALEMNCFSFCRYLSCWSLLVLAWQLLSGYQGVHLFSDILCAFGHRLLVNFGIVVVKLMSPFSFFFLSLSVADSGPVFCIFNLVLLNGRLAMFQSYHTLSWTLTFSSMATVLSSHASTTFIISLQISYTLFEDPPLSLNTISLPN